MKVRTLITAAVLALAVAAPADAAGQRQWEKRVGAWTAYGGISSDNKQMVGIFVAGGDKQFFVKHFAGSQRIVTFQLMKNSWRFPTEGVEVPLRVEFDDGNFPVKARAYMDGGMAIVEFGTADAQIAVDFLDHLAKANKMIVRFEEGDETPWVANMTGSREAVRLFMAGVAAIHNTKPTQPYGPKATQPYGNKPTQPYSQTKPTQPFGPKATQPSGQKPTVPSGPSRDI